MGRTWLCCNKNAIMNAVKIPIGSGERLNAIARRIRQYLDVHPPYQASGALVEIYPVEKRGGLPFSYEWTSPQDGRLNGLLAWQGCLDAWLKEQGMEREFPESVVAIGLRIGRNSSRGPAAQETGGRKSEMIAGEGLATFYSVKPRYKLSDLIVPDAVRDEILTAVAIIKNTDLIYREWGFSEVDPSPRAILNFYGPPGTGKTMAAHGIADELGKRIIVANFAEIESKYVGDSPKNLENIFRQAAADDAVLFFDEADSFLGKRLTSVSSSSDQAVNSLRSKLLQLLEEHTGMVIFCTNLIRNYDKAFESRILRSVKFELPDEDCRRRLIVQKIPRRLPFADGQSMDSESVARIVKISEGFSGREIKNGVLKTLSKVAVSERREFGAQDFIDGFTDMAEEVRQYRASQAGPAPIRDALSKQIAESLAKGDFSTTTQTTKKEN